MYLSLPAAITQPESRIKAESCTIWNSHKYPHCMFLWPFHPFDADVSYGGSLASQPRYWIPSAGSVIVAGLALVLDGVRVEGGDEGAGVRVEHLDDARKEAGHCNEKMNGLPSMKKEIPPLLTLWSYKIWTPHCESEKAGTCPDQKSFIGVQMVQFE